MNHYKSGSDCNDVVNQNGQGYCDGVRTAAAEALVDLTGCKLIAICFKSCNSGYIELICQRGSYQNPWTEWLYQYTTTRWIERCVWWENWHPKLSSRESWISILILFSWVAKFFRISQMLKYGKSSLTKPARLTTILILDGILPSLMVVYLSAQVHMILLWLNLLH